jgi:hypothetical protein
VVQAQRVGEVQAEEAVKKVMYIMFIASFLFAFAACWSEGKEQQSLAASCAVTFMGGVVAGFAHSMRNEM